MVSENGGLGFGKTLLHKVLSSSLEIELSSRVLSEVSKLEFWMMVDGSVLLLEFVGQEL
jgi:hypothetical protein